MILVSLFPRHSPVPALRHVAGLWFGMQLLSTASSNRARPAAASPIEAHGRRVYVGLLSVRDLDAPKAGTRFLGTAPHEPSRNHPEAQYRLVKSSFPKTGRKPLTAA